MHGTSRTFGTFGTFETEKEQNRPAFTGKSVAYEGFNYTIYVLNHSQSYKKNVHRTISVRTKKNKFYVKFNAHILLHCA